MKLQLAHVPIIAITANALKGDAEKALEAGCDVYMSKPINIHELWARVEAYLSLQPEPGPCQAYMVDYSTWIPRANNARFKTACRKPLPT